ncbi:hypothetical protein ACPPVO_22650 [Dactylosporangium sp. McL0621]|uniref:hypothetical protein n=1 Tax=Dactylosporangium sp. McL0621 TaxID=3415678 RepID=UPI003CFA1C87
MLRAAAAIADVVWRDQPLGHGVVPEQLPAVRFGVDRINTVGGSPHPSVLIQGDELRIARIVQSPQQ